MKSKSTTSRSQSIRTFRPAAAAMPIILAVLALACPSLRAQDTSAASYEMVSPGVSADLVEKDLLSGPQHRVQAEAAPYLFDYIYEIDSDFGQFTAHGTKGLAERVNEINAIAALREMKKSKTFTDAAGKAAMSPLNTAKDLVTKPVKTSKGVVNGVVNVGKGAVGGVKSLVDGKKEEKGDYESGALGELSGVAKMKRTVAVKLEVDPYTRNEPFQNELEEVAKTASLGNLGVSALSTVLTGGIATFVTVGSTSANLRAALVDMSPAELRTMNGKTLKSLGVSQAVIDAFQNNTAFLPSQRTVLVGTAGRLEGTAGMESLFALAAGARDEFDTIRTLRTTEMLVAVHLGGATITEFVSSQGLVAGITSDGCLIVPINGRLLAWTSNAEQIANAMTGFQPADKVIAQRELRFPGTVTPIALEKFAALGVTVRGDE